MEHKFVKIKITACECEYCGDMIENKPVQMKHWRDDELTWFDSFECPRKECQDQAARDFDYGKALAKGEV